MASRKSALAEMLGAGGERRHAWRLAVNLSLTAAVGGVLLLLVGALLAAWITFAVGALCAAATALLRRHDHRSPRLR
jgi:hypothetical protein